MDIAQLIIYPYDICDISLLCFNLVSKLIQFEANRMNFLIKFGLFENFACITYRTVALLSPDVSQAFTPLPGTHTLFKIARYFIRHSRRRRGIEPKLQRYPRIPSAFQTTTFTNWGTFRLYDSLERRFILARDYRFRYNDTPAHPTRFIILRNYGDDDVTQ